MRCGLSHPTCRGTQPGEDCDPCEEAAETRAMTGGSSSDWQAAQDRYERRGQ